MPRPTPAAIRKDRERRRQLRRAQNDLYYLACKLGYAWTPSQQQGVTAEYHGPLCKRLDGLRDHPRVGTLAHRKGLKSTVYTICLAVQEILRDPDVTMMGAHAVEGEIQKIVAETGDHFLNNKWLRSLDPIGVYPEGHELAGQEYNVCPRGLFRKRFNTASGFTVSRAGHKPTTRRQKTFFGKGSGSETTGAHVDIFFLDDIIGEKTIEDGLMPKVRNWYKLTVLNVLNTNGKIRLVGTRYDPDDIYQDFIDSKDWDLVVRSRTETDGVMDYNGQPVHYGPGTAKVQGGPEAALKRAESDKRQMGDAHYAAQCMNDPSPAGQKPWDQSRCEHMIGLRPAGGMPGASGPPSETIWVLSDPAPALVGSGDFIKEKLRGDGSKDEWSMVAVKVRWNGDRREAILLEGHASRLWKTDEGMDEACRLMKKYKTKFCIHESYGGITANYFEDMRRATQRNGVSWMKHDYTGKAINFSFSNVKNQKNKRIAMLAEWGMNEEFFICEDTVSADFLHGDPLERHSGFLTQVREFRPLQNGRNNLRHDDRADIVARITDPMVWHYAEHSAVVDSERDANSFWLDQEPTQASRSVYCGV